MEKFVVSLSLVLDNTGYKVLNLITFSSLEELDKYTTLFKNNLELRKEFESKITPYLTKNSSYLENTKQKNGKIMITYIDKNNSTRFFSMLYHDDKKWLDLDLSLNFIFSMFEDINFLTDINKRKKYLLSNLEKELLLSFLETGNLENKRLFINSFKERINNSNNKYLYMRSLLNTARISFKKKIMTLNKEIKLLDSFSYYEYLVSKEDYEELFNTYDLDYLFKNNKEEIPWFVKKIKK